MQERQEHILKLIIEEYLDTAEPVGSALLADEAELDVSGATVRNDMRELEDAGYLTHPHTSAGRIPTGRGYRYYVDHLMKIANPKKRQKEMIDEARDEDVRGIARYLSDEMSAVAMIAFGKDSVYYTGIGNLFREPEFRDYDRMVAVSEAFDRVDECISDLFTAGAGNGALALIGNDNPIDEECSVLVSDIGGHRLLSLVAPLRFDYSRALGLLSYIHEVFV